MSETKRDRCKVTKGVLKPCWPLDEVLQSPARMVPGIQTPRIRKEPGDWLDDRMTDKPRVYNKYAGAPPGTVYIGRGSPWGNPFRISFAQDRATVIERFRCEVLPTLDVTPLIGKNLMCFCAPKPCHGDVLLEAAAKLEAQHSTRLGGNQDR